MIGLAGCRAAPLRLTLAPCQPFRLRRISASARENGENAIASARSGSVHQALQECRRAHPQQKGENEGAVDHGFAPPATRPSSLAGHVGSGSRASRRTTRQYDVAHGGLSIRRGALRLQPRLAKAQAIRSRSSIIYGPRTIPGLEIRVMRSNMEDLDLDFKAPCVASRRFLTLPLTLRRGRSVGEHVGRRPCSRLRSPVGIGRGRP